MATASMRRCKIEVAAARRAAKFGLKSTRAHGIVPITRSFTFYTFALVSYRKTDFDLSLLRARLGSSALQIEAEVFSEQSYTKTCRYFYISFIFSVYSYLLYSFPKQSLCFFFLTSTSSANRTL